MKTNPQDPIRKPVPPRKASELPVLWAETARQMMTPNPISIPADSTLHDAAVLLTDRGFGAVPVIDAAGRPIGVISRTDLVRHDREHVLVESPSRLDTKLATGERIGKGFQIERIDGALVRDVMTPIVLAVDPSTPASQVVTEMIGNRVHRLFVVDETRVLVGVISAFDIVRHLRG